MVAAGDTAEPLAAHRRGIARAAVAADELGATRGPAGEWPVGGQETTAAREVEVEVVVRREDVALGVEPRDGKLLGATSRLAENPLDELRDR